MQKTREEGSIVIDCFLNQYPVESTNLFGA
jgi:hypothetical protein